MAKGAEERLNKAEENIHKEKSYRPGPRTAGVGNERKVDMSVQEGGSKAEAMGMHVGDMKLSSAVKELHSQHPEHHMDRGPHHGGEMHKRHMPLHGMKPGR